MSIRDQQAQLAPFGLILKGSPNATHPPVPTGAFPVLALRVPPGQAAALEEADGVDPTDDANPPAGRRFRRLLRTLVDGNDVLAWRFFREGAQGFVHLQCSSEQATQWFRNLDFAASSTVFEAPRPGHQFFGIPTGAAP